MSQPAAAGDAQHYDLILLGAGSGNSMIGPEMDGWRIAIVEPWVFGGTCLNRGCIPSKMLIHTADLAHAAGDGARFGISTAFTGADWPAIRDRVFGRIDPIAESGKAYRQSLANVDVYDGYARFVGPSMVEVDGRRLSATHIVIATGARAEVPSVPGLDPALGPTVPFHTSDSIMRLDSLPQRMVVLGGGFIAAEMAHVFASLGTEVTIIARGPALLRGEDEQISARFTETVSERYTVHLGATLRSVSADGSGVVVRATVAGEERSVTGDVLLVATGRVPTGSQLDAAAGGIELDGHAVRIDDYGRTTAPGVWAIGDVNGRHQLKHMANGEARVVAHNLVHPDDLCPLDTRPAPHGVFGSPQVGSVGLSERAAVERHGDDVATVTHDYAAAAYGWALEDHTGFVKLVGHRPTRTLLGAHVIGEHAATLVQLLVQGMHLGATVDQLATGQVWIHPTMAEVVEQALLALAAEFDAAS